MSKDKEPQTEPPSTDNSLPDTVATVVHPTEPNIPKRGKTFLDKAAIKAVQEGALKELHVPEWDTDEGACWIRLRLISARERDAFEASMFNKKTGKITEMDNLRARFVVLVASDEQGNRMFSDGDIAWLTNKSAGAVDRIDTAGKQYNGMKVDDVDEKEKN